jgi:dipeptidyl aminopeptidase/acylaminoacyl peptidase
VTSFEGAADGTTIAVLLRVETGWRVCLLARHGQRIAERMLPFAEAGGLRVRPQTRQVSLFGDGEVHLWDTETDTLECLTRGRSGVATFHSWAPDGRRLCFMAFEPGSETPPSLFLWSAAGVAQLPSDPAWPDFWPEWSPDGGLIAYRRGTLHIPAYNAGLWSVPPAGGQPLQLVHAPETVEGLGPGAWSPTGHQLAYTADHGEGATVGIWERDNGTARLLPNLGPITGYPAWSADGSTLLCVLADGRLVTQAVRSGLRGELADFPAPPARQARWAPFSEPLLGGRDGSLWRHGRPGWHRLVAGETRAVPAPEWTTYPASDGVAVPAAVWRGRRGGAWVVWARGGPGGEPDLDSPELAALLDAGYAVLQPDYRGCGGRGRAWAEAGRRDRGGRDAEDVADAARFLVRAGWASPSRIGLLGYSYGAYLALLALERAPASVAAAALLWPVLELANLPALAGIDYTPEEWRALSAVRSPLPHLHRIRTPLLVLHGEQDRAATPEQIGRLAASVPTATVEVFRGDGHGLARNTPAVCRRLLAFLGSHLRAQSV